MARIQKLLASPKRHPTNLKIDVFNKQKDLKLSTKSVKALIKAVLDHQKANFKEIGLYFVSEKKISELHDQFFQDPSPTDCITFPNDQGGEIFVCPYTAIQYAQNRNLDPYKETSLYIIHGLLHLLGFDDLNPKERRIMRKKEKSCMDHIIGLNISLRAE